MEILHYLTKGLEHDFNKCYTHTIKSTLEKV